MVRDIFGVFWKGSARRDEAEIEPPLSSIWPSRPSDEQELEHIGGYLFKHAVRCMEQGMPEKPEDALKLMDMLGVSMTHKYPAL